MTVVSSKEFATKPARYYNLAVNEPVVIKRGNNMFHLMYKPVEKPKERVYFEPDDDFYRSISVDEFRERAREVVKAAYKRYKNESDNFTGSP